MKSGNEKIRKFDYQPRESTPDELNAFHEWMNLIKYLYFKTRPGLVSVLQTLAVHINNINFRREIVC